MSSGVDSVIKVEQAQPNMGGIQMAELDANARRAVADRQNNLLKKPEYNKSTICLDSALVFPLDSVTAAGAEESMIKLKPTRSD